MSLSPGWRRVFRLSLGKRSAERDLDDELAFHLAMREEKLRREGVSEDMAREWARERFGDPAKVRDECLTIDSQYAREVRLMEWLESLWSDARYAFRTLRRVPAFTTVAILTLALGIGATSAMFTLVNSIILRPLPYPNADRLVRIIQSYPERGLAGWGLSQENIVMYRDGASDFDAFSAYRADGATLTSPSGAERLSLTLVTADFFRVMGVSPFLGRPFTREEDAPGRNDVAVISHGMWETRFGGDRGIIGRTIELDGRPVRIIGVMPRDFAFPNTTTRAWLPMGLDPLRTHAWLNSGVARLKPGITVAHAERQTTGIMWDWARRNQGMASVDPAKTRMKTIVTPLHQAITGRTTKPLSILLAAVSLILLIATANVATLLSSRSAAREREISLRAALGATRGRVVRQLITESIALSLLGAIAGIGLAVFVVRAFTRSGLASLPRMEEVHVDGRVLAVTLVVSVVSGLLFGLLPALHGARSRLTGALTAGQRESAHGSVRRFNNGLVVAQLSLSVVLLIAAGLILRSFQRLIRTDIGYRAEGVTAIALPLPPRIDNAGAMNAFVTSVLQDVRATPGVQAASLSWEVPFEGNANVDGYLIDGRPTPPSGNEDQIRQIGVSPGYFATLGIPIVYGRDVTASDDTTGLPVALVDENLAKRYWTGAEALGKRIRVGGDSTWFTIVGVVGNVRDQDVATLPGPHLYNSLVQVGGNPLSLAVKTAGDPGTVIAGVRQVVSRIDPTIPLDAVRSVASFRDRSLDVRRLTEILLGGFALLAVTLAAVGVYGVMSLSVANRHREFGVRLAVGAEPNALLRRVLTEGALLASIGVGIGVAGALVATRWIGSLLYEVSPTDPLVFGVLSATLGLIAVGSCYLPARRAARSDPLAVLRAD